MAADIIISSDKSRIPSPSSPTDTTTAAATATATNTRRVPISISLVFVAALALSGMQLRSSLAHPYYSQQFLRIAQDVPMQWTVVNSTDKNEIHTILSHSTSVANATTPEPLLTHTTIPLSIDKNKQNSSIGSNCLPIYLLPGVEDDYSQGEHRHYVIEGIQSSPYLKITNDPTDGHLWIMDQLRSTKGADDETVGCRRILRLLTSALQQRQLQQPTPTSNTIPSRYNNTWTLLHLDWSDTPIHNFCPELVQWEAEIQSSALATFQVHWLVRSTIRKAGVILEWIYGNTTTNGESHRTLMDWHIPPMSKVDIPLTGPLESHIPYHVRTDHVQMTAAALSSYHDIDSYPPAKEIVDKKYLTKKTKGKNVTRFGGNTHEEIQEFAHRLVTLPKRNLDVCHFWPRKWHDHQVPYQSALRDAVSDTLSDQWLTANSLSGMVGTKGKLAKLGRNEPQHLYAKKLLQCKIVVATQRDHHEDMYRLMEALSSGAMVLSDPMLRPPPGLIRETNWDIFSNKTELLDKIIYYSRTDPAKRIEIAKQGWILAMTQYRSWHFMEKLVYGAIQSTGILPPIKDPNCQSL